MYTPMRHNAEQVLVPTLSRDWPAWSRESLRTCCIVDSLWGRLPTFVAAKPTPPRGGWHQSSDGDVDCV